MISLSELQTKEVVLLETGKRLGFIVDFELDDTNGFIKALIVASRQTGGNLFNRATEIVILWENIETIGDDFILIKENGPKKMTNETNMNE